jgi:hypothetical protein
VEPADLRPLRVGEVLDAAINIYRRRFGTLIRAVAVVVVPIGVLNAVVLTSARSDAATASGIDPAAAGASVVTTLVGLIATQLAVAAAFSIVSGDYLDQSPTWQESLRAGFGRLRSLLWLELVHVLLLIGGFIACVIPGIYLYVAWSAALPALLFEDRRGTKALGRSRELFSGRWWPTAAALFVAFVLSAIITGALSGLVVGVVGSGDFTSDVLGALVRSAGTILTTPFTAAVVTVLYFDARVRKEGFDLELLARRIGVEPPPRDPAAPLPPPSAGEEPPFWPPPPGWRPGG